MQLSQAWKPQHSQPAQSFEALLHLVCSASSSPARLLYRVARSLSVQAERAKVDLYSPGGLIAYACHYCLAPSQETQGKEKRQGRGGALDVGIMCLLLIVVPVSARYLARR